MERPWQKLAVDLVGPLPEEDRGNRWILVLTDHFTRWQNALAIPDATAPVIATTLDESYVVARTDTHRPGRSLRVNPDGQLCEFEGVNRPHTAITIFKPIVLWNVVREILCMPYSSDIS